MKRLSLDSKIYAYNDVIAFLDAFESESDTDEDIIARKWLREKLDKESNRLVLNNKAHEK